MDGYVGFDHVSRGLEHRAVVERLSVRLLRNFAGQVGVDLRPLPKAASLQPLWLRVNALTWQGPSDDNPMRV